MIKKVLLFGYFLYGHYDALRTDLINTGAVEGFCESSYNITSSAGGTVAVKWPGKRPDEQPLLFSCQVTHDYGKTIGWQVIAGRDFSRAYSTDSLAMIVNETAAALMRLKDPVGETIGYNNRDYHIIGVIKDMVRQSPFAIVEPAFFVVDYESVNVITVRLSSQLSLHKSITKVEKVFRKHNPTSPFDFRFVDDQYARKFMDEERIGTLATFFATLAIVISCLGIFGLASFVAEQRPKEIGVRKVLGVSVVRLWKMLSQEFVVLVMLSLVIAMPLAWYVMSTWLRQYAYRIDISWWIFAAAGGGAPVVTLLTVSYRLLRPRGPTP